MSTCDKGAGISEYPRLAVFRKESNANWLLEVIDDKGVLLPLRSSRTLQILPVLRTLLAGSPCPGTPISCGPQLRMPPL